jgi:hypothetical protein
MGQQASHIKNDTNRKVKVTLVSRIPSGYQNTFTMAPYEELRFGGFHTGYEFSWNIGNSSVKFHTDTQYIYDGCTITKVGWGDLHGPHRNVSIL